MSMFIYYKIFIINIYYKLFKKYREENYKSISQEIIGKLDGNCFEIEFAIISKILDLPNNIVLKYHGHHKVK